MVAKSLKIIHGTADYKSLWCYFLYAGETHKGHFLDNLGAKKVLAPSKWPTMCFACIKNNLPHFLYINS